MLITLRIFVLDVLSTARGYTEHRPSQFISFFLFLLSRSILQSRNIADSPLIRLFSLSPSHFPLPFHRYKWHATSVLTSNILLTPQFVFKPSCFKMVTEQQRLDLGVLVVVELVFWIFLQVCCSYLLHSHSIADQKIFPHAA